MRRLAGILAAAIALVLTTSTAAHAAPGTDSTDEANVDKLVVRSEAKADLTATFRSKADSLQDPPMGGCDYSDVTGQITGYYVNGVLSTTESSWSAKVICYTTAAGQSMGGIIVDSTEWHNGSNIANGVEFSCTDCNLGNSPGNNIGGPSAWGTYFWSGTTTLVLPEGWIWSGEPDGCLLLAEDMLQCAATSSSVYLPPTYNP